MNRIKIADRTLCSLSSSLSFKEKLEVARQLDKLKVDTIEFSTLQGGKTDALLIRSVSAFAKCKISVAVASSLKEIEEAAAALSAAKKPSIRVELPMSPVGMEYTLHKKAPKMIEWIKEIVAAATKVCSDVEFCALDATRAEPDFLKAAIDEAIAAGAKSITIVNDAGDMLPDEFAEFVANVTAGINVPVGVDVADTNGCALSAAMLSLRKGVAYVKTSVADGRVSLEKFAHSLGLCSSRIGVNTNVSLTEIHRTANQIAKLSEVHQGSVPCGGINDEDATIRLDENDNQKAVMAAVLQLGYDLSEEDKSKVYEEFLHVANGKVVGARELDAIVASVALQVPQTYVLDTYLINASNVASCSAQITLKKNDAPITGICVGNGPIDAAFLALEQIIGVHYEVDDFQVQALTEGKEALGFALVKLRANGKVYSGRGIAADIICASVRAYVSAINKIVYEEA